MRFLLEVFKIFLVVLLQGHIIKAQSHDDILAGRLKDHVSVLASDSLEGRGLGTEGKVLAKKYIADQFNEIGLTAFNDDFFHHFDLRIGLARVPATNIAGYIPGSDPDLKQEYIVIGAHYDHVGYEHHNDERVIFPGADDNASGTAVLIELAAYFASNPQLAGRTIVFVAFDAEESGLLGSERFISDKVIQNTDDIKVMFSLDMVGMYGANGGLDLLGIGTLEGGTELAGKVATMKDVSLNRVSSDIPARTDTRPFGDKGIPSIQAFTGLKSPYHKPEDTYDLLDYDGMARVTLYLQKLVSEISFSKDLAPSRRFARMQRPGSLRASPGIILNTGSSHLIYTDEFFRANSVFAFGTGVFLQMRFGQRNYSLQPELLYDYSGSKSPAGSYRRHSITVPVNLQLIIAGDNRGMFRIYSIAGGYYRYNFAGQDGGVSLDFDNLHPVDEWGINLGLGADIMKVHMAYVWRRGLTDITAGVESGRFIIGHYFTLGYRF